MPMRTSGMHALLMNCTGWRNGAMASPSNNAVTSHDDVVMAVIGGRFGLSRNGTDVHCIEETKTFILGAEVIARDPDGTSTAFSARTTAACGLQDTVADAAGGATSNWASRPMMAASSGAAITGTVPGPTSPPTAANPRVLRHGPAPSQQPHRIRHGQHDRTPGLAPSGGACTAEHRCSARTVEVIWSTGARVRRASFFGEPYDEELSLDPAHVRLERLNAGAPFLKVHALDTLDAVHRLGCAGSARIVDGRGTAQVRISERTDVEPIWRIS